MNFYKQGDTQKVICQSCKSLQVATYDLRNVPLSDGSGEVKNILVGVCDNCDQIAVIPHQSTPAIKEQMQTQRKAVESRVPAHMIDILNMVSDQLGAETDFSSQLLKFYIHVLATEEFSSKGFEKYLRNDLAHGKATRRVSIKGRYIADEIETLKAAVQIDKTSDLIKGVVLKINDDVLVKKKPGVMRRLQGIVAATA